MKIDDKIALAEHKLGEVKTKFEGDKADLTRLIQKRAKLEAEAVLENERDTKGITEIERQRDRVRSQLEIYPGLVKEIEGTIEDLKREKEAGILKKNLVEQRKTAREVERLSQELGILLGKANDVNVELQKHRSQYFELHKLTNQNVFEKPTTSGSHVSHGSLKILAGVINAELKGHPRPSPRFPPPGPAI
ncbi:hypothetical protein ES702_04518 [subsurface metagenome]